MSAPPGETGGEDRLGLVCGALLLGGASSRMGEDKARRLVLGEPAARRLARLLDALCGEVLLVGGRPPEEAPGRRVADPQGAPACALRGLVAALEATRAPFVLALAVDQLAATPPLLLGLAAWGGSADAVVPRTAEGPQPLCALYRSETVRPRARAHLEAGRLALRDLLAALRVDWLEGPGLEAVAPGGRALESANTPEAWRRLEARLAREAAPTQPS